MRSRAALIGVGLAVLAASVLAQAPSPALGTISFEAASIKRNTSRRGVPAVQPGGRFVATGTPLQQLILFAYDLTPIQLVGTPDWASTEWFDIAATAGRDARPDEVRVMLQALLQDRFHLALHKEQREMAIHEVVFAKTDGRLGPRIVQVSSEDECRQAAAKLPPRPDTGRGTAVAIGCGSASQLAHTAFPMVQTAVVDKTGLTGIWSWSMYFDGTMLPGTPDSQRVANPNLPSFSTALEEQLGLKLRATRGLVDVLVIDHVERPAED